MSLDNDRVLNNSEMEFERAQSSILEGIKGMHKIADVKQFPCYFSKGSGCRLWDIDGNEYIDYVMGKGPYILGIGNKEVDNAVIEQITKGNVFPMGHMLHTELAEKIIKVVPSAEKVSFYKTGSCATSAAIRLARTYTGKDIVLSSGYHGWHDWCNGGEGVPKEMDRFFFDFEYDLDRLRDFLENNKNSCCAVIISPECSYFTYEYYHELEEICRRYKVLFILDEVKTGFRVMLGGFQERYGLSPDLSIFSKAIANGYSLSAVCGREEVMNCSAQIHTAGTFDTEVIPFVAANVVVDHLINSDALTQIHRKTDLFVKEVNKVFEKAKVDIHAIGEFGSFRFWFRDPDFETEFYIKAAKYGILFYPYDNSFICEAHSDEDILETSLRIEKLLLSEFAEKQTGHMAFELDDIKQIKHRKNFLHNYPGAKGHTY